MNKGFKLKLLAISDVHSPDNFFITGLEKTKVDLIVTLGDVSPSTIDYILFMAKNIPVIGILGNHDPEEIPGLDALHCKTTDFFGYTFGGFNGAKKYKNHPNHFEEKYVAKKMKKMPYVDIFISHSPPFSVSEKEDHVHQGFRAFDVYMEKFKPKYWLHGHLQRYYSEQIDKTTIIGIDKKRYLTL